MIQSLELHARNRVVNSPFGLLGTDENALSFALGYTFQKCLPLLQWFLKEIGIAGVTAKSLRGARIDLQRNVNGEGVTDIEIHLRGRLHVIVEAKVGLGVPTIEQCLKYLPRFSAKEPIQKLVSLVQSPDKSYVKDYFRQETRLSSRLVPFIWARLLPECRRLMLSGSLSSDAEEWVRCFHTFLDQEFSMKAFTTEVWILPAAMEKLWPNGMTHWEIHQKHRVWWSFNQHAVRPLYMAFRAGGSVGAIYRVTRVEHMIPIVDRVPPMRQVRASWARAPATIWHFGLPVPLARPIKTGGGMYSRRVRCDLDLLLTCDSVREIEAEMGKRKQQAED